MDILVVTGRIAEKAVKKSVQNDADVFVLGIDVAAFTTPALLRCALPDKKYDIILIPGLASGNFSELEKEINTQIRLGPKHAVDLGFVLSFADETVFSQKIPACELLSGKRRENAFEKITELEQKAVPSFVLKGVKLGGNSRMKVMAEIVDAGALSQENLINRISYFEQMGADIIDLGISLDMAKEKVRNAVKTAKSNTILPLSIDTLDPDLINAALDAGIDIVLSLDSENIDEVKDSIIRNCAAAVVIPDCSDELESLFSNIGAAQNAGIKNIIADPVLEPIGHGFAEAVNRYYEFRKRDQTTALFFGAGNVTELIDADSIGINAMLSGIAMELGADILFTPEFSDKAHNSVFELRTASMMMMLAKERGSAPKELGIDLLAIKEKRMREFGKLPVDAIEAESSKQWHLDPAGCFRIEITGEEIRSGRLYPGKIVAKHKNGSIAGATAKEVLDTILRLGLVSRPDHAGYLGRELMKAELALKFKRSYAQDDRF